MERGLPAESPCQHLRYGAIALGASGRNQVDNEDEILAVDKINWNGTTPTTSTFWTFADHQGTIRDIVSGNAADRGKVVEHRQYDSFGKVLARTANLSPGAATLPGSGVGVAFGYTGRPIDEKTGLSDYRARWYDANTGRFINEDPSGFKGGDTNLFRYVGNDPLDRIDPSGLTAKWAGYGGKGSVPAAGWGAYGLLASGASSPANTFTGKSDRGVPFGEFLVTRSSSGAITPQSSLPDTRSLSGYDRVSLGVHGTLSIAGAVPLFGIIPDAIDWAYTAAELPFGKSTKTDLALATAGIAATAAPFIGDGAAAALKMSARVARIGGNTASDVVRVAGRFDIVAEAGNNRAILRSGGLDRIPQPRSPGLGPTATTRQLIESGNIPGIEGVVLNQQVVKFDDIWKMSENTGLEFALTRENGNYVLRSGSQTSVPVPRGIRPIAHTHPVDPLTGETSLLPSRADMNTLNNVWNLNPSAPRPVSQIITGPGRTTVFRATGLESVPAPRARLR